jgi:hypothetical protein
MSDAIHVKSIQTLRDLETSLGRFAGEAQEALNSADLEIRRTLERLQDRLRHWSREVERRQQEVQAAQAALQRCLNSGYYDRDGRYHAPSCGGYETALLTARRRLQEAQTELQNTSNWLNRAKKAEANYRKEARRLEQMASSSIPRARALLNRKVTELDSYLAVSAFSAAVASAAALAGAGVPISQVFEDYRKSWGGSVSGVAGAIGEHLAALVAKDLGLKEIPFDQPKHGFDRVFSAPGIPAIVVESKVASDGKLHLGKTKDGKQLSTGWIRARTDKMADRDSAQWSPANERIAALIKEIGPENVPALSVVINPTTEMADVYYRQGKSDMWSILQQGISLQGLLED